MAEGMLCKETHTHVIRVAPPLTITAEEVDRALERQHRGSRRGPAAADAAA